MSFQRGLILFISHSLVAVTAILIYPYLTTERQTQHEPSANTASSERPLFRVEERVYRFEDLPREYRQPLFEIRNFAFQQQLPLIEDALVEVFIQHQMRAQQADRMTVQNQLMPGAEPSEAEIEQFYAENQSESAPPLDKIRQELHTYLTAAKQEKLKKTLLTRLLVEGKAQVLAEAPQRGE